MQPEFVFSIHDLQLLGVRDVESPLSAAWVAAAIAETDVKPVEGKPGRLQMRLMMSGRDVIVRGSVEAFLVAECGRCLQPAYIDVKTELSLMLVPGKVVPPPRKDVEGETAGKPKRGKSRGEAEGAVKRPSNGKAAESRGGKWVREDGEEMYEFEAAEAGLDTYSGDEVTLDSFVREAILLEIPIYPLCSEACPGIGPVPAEASESDPMQLTIDPRLAPLLALKKKS